MQITATAVPEATDPDDASVTVRAFIDADLPLELIELLEKIILEPSAFSKNCYLQNLLVLTAIRAEKGKVVNYINRLTNYDYEEIARIAKEHGLYEEALTVYKKYDNHALAMNVLVEDIVSIDRAVDFATKVNKPEVWSRLAKAQLDGLRIKDVIGNSTSARSDFSLTSTQSRTLRLAILQTSLKSLSSPTELASRRISSSICRWLARRSENRKSTPNSLTRFMIWRIILA
jgi:hypothetical protein